MYYLPSVQGQILLDIIQIVLGNRLVDEIDVVFDICRDGCECAMNRWNGMLHHATPCLHDIYFYPSFSLPLSSRQRSMQVIRSRCSY